MYGGMKVIFFQDLLLYFNNILFYIKILFDDHSVYPDSTNFTIIPEYLHIISVSSPLPISLWNTMITYFTVTIFLISTISLGGIV